MPETEKTTHPNAGYAVKAIFAIGITFGTILFVLPAIFSMTTSVTVMVCALFALIPILPALQTALMQDERFQMKRLLFLWTHHFMAMMFELIYIFLFLPFVMLPFFLVINGIFLITMALPYIQYVLQQGLGIHLGSAVTTTDLWEMLPFLSVSLAIEIALALVGYQFKKRGEKASDWVKERMQTTLDGLHYIRKGQ